MENLHRLTSEALVDIVSTQTAAYLQMQTEGGADEQFKRCKLLLRAVQKEIHQRSNNNQMNSVLLEDENLDK